MSFSELTEKLKRLEDKNNRQFKEVFKAINYLLNKDQLEIEQDNEREQDSKRMKMIN